MWCANTAISIPIISTPSQHLQSLVIWTGKSLCGWSGCIWQIHDESYTMFSPQSKDDLNQLCPCPRLWFNLIANDFIVLPNMVKECLPRAGRNCGQSSVSWNMVWWQLMDTSVHLTARGTHWQCFLPYRENPDAGKNHGHSPVCAELSVLRFLHLAPHDREHTDGPPGLSALHSADPRGNR